MDDLTPLTRWRFARWLGPIVIASLVIALVVVILGLRRPGPPSALSGPLPALGANWRTYHDPGDAFSVRIPTDWQVTQDGGGTFGNSRDQIDYAGVMWSFHAPTPTLAQRGPSLGVEVYPLTDERHRQYLCQHLLFPGSVTSYLGHVGAQTVSESGQMELYAQSAYITLLPWYPGAPGVHSQPQGVPLPTPVPSAVAQAGKQLIDQIVKSFRVIPDEPLHC